MTEPCAADLHIADLPRIDTQHLLDFASSVENALRSLSIEGSILSSGDADREEVNTHAKQATDSTRSRARAAETRSATRNGRRYSKPYCRSSSASNQRRKLSHGDSK